MQSKYHGFERRSLLKINHPKPVVKRSNIEKQRKIHKKKIIRYK